MKKVIQPNVRKVYGPSTQESQMHAVRKIHNLLSSGAVSVTGPTQPRILKKTTTICNASSSAQSGIHNNQSNSVQQVTLNTVRCYVCDDPSSNQGVVLHETHTAHTNTSLPKKIGQVLGEGFTVIISFDDVVCKRCLALINTFDRLDSELSRVKSNLLNFLFRKYGLSEDDRQAAGGGVPSSPPVKMQKLNSGTVISRKVNNDDEPEIVGGITRKIAVQNRDTIDSQLSNMFDESEKLGSTTVTKTRTVAQIMPQPQVKKTPIKIYKCMSCDFQTTELKQFQPHYEMCKAANQKCKICKRTFANANALKQHMTEKHSNEHVCTYCNISFGNEMTLKRHTELNHPETKIEQPASPQTFSCNMCPYKTTDKQNYDEHLKKHMKVKPFKCRVCMMRFETREQASTHSKTHQPNYFKCATCSASFQQRELLVKHFETHQQTPKTSMTQSAAMTTQKLLQDTIDEALRGDNLETKGIHFFSCNICSLTFIQESYYNQHMETHKNENKKQSITTATSSPQSLIRQDVRTTNANILTTTQSSTISEVDIESIFEKMHSDKTETETGNSNSQENLVITSQENAGGITFNITIPDNPNQIKKMTNEGLDGTSTSTAEQVSVGIDMPVLDQPEDTSNQRTEQKSDQMNEGEQQEQVQAAPVSMPSLDDEGDSQSQPSNTDQVPMDLEDIQNSVESGQIKFIVNENGQLLQLDNHIITTDADGNQILVQGTEQIQQLLQSVGVLQSGDGLDGETLQMIGDNNQMIIVQQGDNEAQLIDASLLNADGHIVIQQAQEGELTEGAHTISEDGVRIPVSVAFTSHEQGGESIGITDVTQQEQQELTEQQTAQINTSTELNENQEQKQDNSNQVVSTTKTEQTVTTQSLTTSTGEAFFALEDLMQQSEQKPSD